MPNEGVLYWYKTCRTKISSAAVICTHRLLQKCSFFRHGNLVQNITCNCLTKKPKKSSSHVSSRGASLLKAKTVKHFIHSLCIAKDAVYIESSVLCTRCHLQISHFHIYQDKLRTFCSQSKVYTTGLSYFSG